MGLHLVLFVALLVLLAIRGYGRQRSTSALFSNQWLVHLVLVGFLLVVVLIGGSPLLIVPVLLLLAFLIWVAYRERVTKRNLGRAEAAAAASWGRKR